MRSPEQPLRRRAADLTYNHQGELWFVTRSHWTPGNCNSRVRDQVLEFKGSGRARYMTRQRDPGYIYTPAYKDLSTQALPETAIWSDYDGDEIYGDYTVDSAGAVIDKTAYLPGIGQIDYSTVGTTTVATATYYHADHLGTLRATTNGAGASVGVWNGDGASFGAGCKTGTRCKTGTQLVFEADPTGAVIDKTAYLPGIGQINNLATENADKVTYYHTDHLGTLRATTNGAGALAAAMVYTAFGETVAADGTIGGAGSSGSRYQYAGDSGYESGLLPSIDLGSGNSIPALPWQHVGARWYDPSTGRFLQRDPIGIYGGLNVYCYADNTPTDVVDPDGLDIIAVQWRERGPFGHDVGHTALYVTSTCAWISHVPKNFWTGEPYTDRTPRQDFGTYSKNDIIVWRITGLNEDAVTKKGLQLVKGRWWWFGNNCVHTTMRALRAGGARRARVWGFRGPWDGRRYLDQPFPF